jgi:hypothetical protein
MATVGVLGLFGMGVWVVGWLGLCSIWQQKMIINE